MIHNLCRKHHQLQREEVRDRGVMKWTSTVIITIIIELFSKIQERLYNFHIIQADYDSQPLSKRAVSTVKPPFSKTPKFTLDISSLLDDNDSLAKADTATSTSKITGPATSSSHGNVQKRSVTPSSHPSLHDNVPKRGLKSKGRGNC